MLHPELRPSFIPPDLWDATRTLARGCGNDPTLAFALAARVLRGLAECRDHQRIALALADLLPQEWSLMRAEDAALEAQRERRAIRRAKREAAARRAAARIAS